jgi:hypothetical protein
VHRIKSFRIAACVLHAYDPRTVSNGWRQSMLLRLILLISILLQAAGVSTLAAHAQTQYPTFNAIVCKGDVAPSAPHSPADHGSSCSDCIACCNAPPSILCVSEQVARLSFPNRQIALLALPIFPISRTRPLTPPARASPA